MKLKKDSRYPLAIRDVHYKRIYYPSPGLIIAVAILLKLMINLISWMSKLLYSLWFSFESPDLIILGVVFGLETKWKVEKNILLDVVDDFGVLWPKMVTMSKLGSCGLDGVQSSWIVTVSCNSSNKWFSFNNIWNFCFTPWHHVIYERLGAERS